MRASSRLKYARLALVGSGLAAAGLPQAAWATDQQGATAAAPAAKVDQANEDRVQDIVVTAQRRKERLQDVPIATTVVGADRTVASRITESSQIASLVPNLQINGSFAAIPKITLRGIGTNDFVPNLNPAVGTYVDDVYMGLAIGQNFQLFDLDRVEVLRGPQGTLYGKNTTGGAIKYVTRKPESTDGQSYALATIGNYNRFELETGLNLPISSAWSARVSGVMRRADGYIWNPILNRDENWVDAWATRGQLRYNPSAATDILIQAYYSKSKADGVIRRLEGPLPGGTDILGNTSPPYRISINGTPGYENVEQHGVNLIANIGTPIGQLSSISSYEHVVRDEFDDSDNGPRDLVTVRYYTKAWSAGQELRLSGDAGPLKWSLGGQYYHEQFDNFFDLDFFPCTADANPCVFNPNGVALPAGYIGFTQFPNIPTFAAEGIVGLPIATSGKYPWSQTNDSYALFTDSTLSLTSRLKVIAGVRWSSETRHFSGKSHLYPTLAPQAAVGLFPSGFPSVNLRKSWNNVSGRFVLDYKPTNDQLFYLSYSTGFRSGNFNSGAYTSLAAISQIVNPEQVKSFELGAKTQWLDHRVQANLALFYMKYDNLQVSVFRNATSLLTNAAKADVKGGEFELVATPVHGLNLRAAIGYLDAKYTNFIYNQSPLVDLSGNTLVNAPRWTSTLSVDYEAQLDSRTTFKIGGDLRSQSKVYFTVFNEDAMSQDAYSILNLRVGLAWPASGLSATIFATNVTDRIAAVDGLTVGAPFGVNSRQYNRPRMIGLTLNKTF